MQSRDLVQAGTQFGFIDRNAWREDATRPMLVSNDANNSMMAAIRTELLYIIHHGDYSTALVNSSNLRPTRSSTMRMQCQVL